MPVKRTLDDDAGYTATVPALKVNPELSTEL